MATCKNQVDLKLCIYVLYNVIVIVNILKHVAWPSSMKQSNSVCYEYQYRLCPWDMTFPYVAGADPPCHKCTAGDTGIHDFLHYDFYSMFQSISHISSTILKSLLRMDRDWKFPASSCIFLLLLQLRHLRAITQATLLSWPAPNKAESLSL